MTLEQLPPGQRAVICEVTGDEALRARMLALGLRLGREVAVIRRARLGGPLQVRIGTTDLVVRRREARLIKLTTPTA
ncbi:MAG: ferrous iron transport protein A [Gammaproteobacteria bacterium HGW-Gammaproteobacteria-1]|nr:MAG: ferrous iron transport protein A [Gammaproteobacteria bacterium HGW-Gammaproteobacteria-1]